MKPSKTTATPTTNNTLIIGLTGGIGSGKTAVSDRFAELGIDIIDADVIARQVVEVGSPVLQAIQEHFGEDILLENGTLNRKKLRDIIFTDNNQKQWLNDLMHPAIRQQQIQALQAAQSAYVILSSPLLVEMGMETQVNRVLVVDVPEEVQIARASRRDDVDPAQIESIISSQALRSKRLEKADDVIDNSGDIEELMTQVAELHQQYLAIVNNA